jgi:hypothetical protein
MMDVRQQWRAEDALVRTSLTAGLAGSAMDLFGQGVAVRLQCRRRYRRPASAGIRLSSGLAAFIYQMPSTRIDEELDKFGGKIGVTDPNWRSGVARETSVIEHTSPCFAGAPPGAAASISVNDSRGLLCLTRNSHRPPYVAVARGTGKAHRDPIFHARHDVRS